MRGMRSFDSVPTCSGWGVTHGSFSSAQDDDRVASQTWMRNRVCVFLSNEIGDGMEGSPSKPYM